MPKMHHHEGHHPATKSYASIEAWELLQSPPIINMILATIIMMQRMTWFYFINNHLMSQQRTSVGSRISQPFQSQLFVAIWLKVHYWLWSKKESLWIRPRHSSRNMSFIWNSLSLV
jgi:hypothetical protein